jgi:hypothetical protein
MTAKPPIAAAIKVDFKSGVLILFPFQHGIPGGQGNGDASITAAACVFLLCDQRM